MTAMQAAMWRYQQRVIDHVQAGRDSDEAREDAIAMFRAAACIVPDLAECGICGRNKPVCCDSGYTEREDGTREHVGAICVDCCHHGAAVWDGKSVAGGTYERGE